MTKQFLMASAVALGILGGAAGAQATTIAFGASTPDPNGTSIANTNAYGSNAHVSVGYGPSSYNYSGGYGGLGGGTGIAVYSDETPPTYQMTFQAAAGYVVTLVSFDLAAYTTHTDSVDITASGASGTYTTTDTPAGGSGFTTYSPGVTGSLVTLTITNLYNVGINNIVYSATATAVPEPASMVLLGAGLLGLGLVRRRG